jgi:hypothetical protein
VTETPASGKGRPTPKRRDAERRRGGPVAPPPTNRREAARRVREQAAEQRKQVRAGTKAGDPRHMLARDQGPVRALIRDLVDSRRHLGVLLLPAALLPILAQLTRSSAVVGVATLFWLSALVAAFVDFVIVGFVVRRRIRQDFPEERSTRAHIFYALMRTFQLRRFRLPPPRVSVGDSV